LIDPCLNDFPQRREAIVADWHAFVWASAGTGKTHTLTLRALYLLINAPFLSSSRTFPQLAELYSEDEPARFRAARTAIHSLVLTTFTRKASAEMQTRLYELLDSLASARDWTEIRDRYADSNPLLFQLCEIVAHNLSPSSTEQGSFARFQAGLKALADLAPELQICTLHSFATSILRRHPLFSGIAPGTRFAREDEDDFEEVPEQVVRCWWRQQVIEGTELERDLSQVLEVAPLQQVQNWLKIICRHPWIAGRLNLDNELCSAATRSRLLAASSHLVDRLEKQTTSGISRNRENLKAAIRRIQAGDQSAWSQFYAFTLAKDIEKLFLDHKSTTKAVRDAIAGLPPDEAAFFEERPRYQEIIAACTLSLDYPEHWGAWKRVVSSFADWSGQAAIRELGVVSFDDMIESAVRLLEENAPVRRIECARLRALLVDEFQDTDVLQLRLLQALLTRDPETGHEPLGFFVGDRKQSIYRFRGADPPAVDDFCSRYAVLTQARLKKKEYQLSTTFRCQPSIARFVNHFFTDEVELAAPSEWLHAMQQDEHGPVEWRCIEPPTCGDKVLAPQLRQLAAWQVVQLIEEYRQSTGHRLTDILILVKTGTELDAVLPVLQGAGIPIVSSGARTFYRQPEVLDVVNLLIALLNPLDSIATAAVLRSPCLGLSDPQIYSLFKKLPAEKIFHGSAELPDGLPEPAKARIQHMRTLVQQRRTLTLSDWLGAVRSLLPLHLYVKQNDKEGRALYRIERVFERLQRELEEGTRAPIPWLLSQRLKVSTTRDWEANLGEDVSIADDTVEAVRIMTIHKAKGLEGRFVIVYNWMEILDSIERGKNKDDLSVISCTGEGGEAVREFCLDWGPIRVSSPGYRRAKEESRRLESREAKRLAYVAATRARGRLTLVCPPGNKGPDNIPILIERMRAASRPDSENRLFADHEKGFRFCFLRATEPIQHTVSVQTLGAAFQEEYHQVWQKRIAGFRNPAPPLLTSPSRTDEERQPEQAPPEALLEAGRLVHSYLERHLLAAEFDAARLQGILTNQTGTSCEEAIRLSSIVLSRFHQEGNHYRSRLSSCRVLGQEVPFYLFYEERAWNGIIDLIIEENGVIRGIDYKMSSRKEPLPEAYLRQKRVYSEAIRRLFAERTVDFEFWWLS
jgi:ATP-dependent helicase/nuclease subunit A